MPTHTLLIVDLQVNFKPDPAVIARIARAIPHYDHAVLTQFQNSDGSAFRRVLGWHDDGGELLLSVPDAQVFKKHGYGLSAGQLGALRAIGADNQIDVAGCETSACCLAICFQLFDAGIAFRLRADLCCDITTSLHEAAIAIAARSLSIGTGNPFREPGRSRTISENTLTQRRAAHALPILP